MHLFTFIYRLEYEKKNRNGVSKVNNDKLTNSKIVFLLASVCCFLWGSATPSIKTGYQIFNIVSGDTASIIVFAGTRFFLAGILVILIQSIMQKKVILPAKGSLWPIVCLSLAQTIIQYFCFYVGLAHTSGVAGTIVSGASGMVSILLVCLVFRQEKLTGNKLIGCILGFIGIVIMNVNFKGGTSIHFSLLGEGLVLASTVSLAVSGIMVKGYSKKFNVVMLSGYQFILGGFVMIVVGLIAGGRIPMNVGFGGWALMLYLALISAVAYSLWGILLAHNPVSKVTIYSFFTPLYGVILSAIVLNELDQALQLNKILALVLVCLGTYAVNRPQKQIEK